MATLTIRQLDDALVRRIKMREERDRDLAGTIPGHPPDGDR